MAALCEYPSCDKPAQWMNEGGFWCEFPHPTPASTEQASPDVEALAEWFAEHVYGRGDMDMCREAAVDILASPALAAGRADALLPIRRFAESRAITAKARGRNDRDWLDLLILVDRAEGGA